MRRKRVGEGKERQRQIKIDKRDGNRQMETEAKKYSETEICTKRGMRGFL